jgi:hypothetical protein
MSVFRRIERAEVMRFSGSEKMLTGRSAALIEAVANKLEKHHEWESSNLQQSEKNRTIKGINPETHLWDDMMNEETP